MVTQQSLDQDIVELIQPIGSPQQCSTFFFRHSEGFYLGANVDFPTKSYAHGFVLANPRGAWKEPLRLEGIPSSPWRSKYGSITFTDHGKDYPNAGMNEEGLVLAPMSLPTTQYPPIGTTPRLQLGQWKQHIIDSYASVGEVLDHITDVEPVGHSSHFLIADANGDCAAIEFLEGRAVCRTSEELEIAAITNHSYADCVEFLASLGEDGSLEDANPSLRNFANMARELRSEDLQTCADPIDRAFAILDSASMPGLTQRSTVYDIRGRRLFFRTQIEGSVACVGMKDLNLSVGASPTVVPLAAGLSGDVTADAVLLTREANVAAAEAMARMLLEFVPADQQVPLLPIAFGEMMEKVIAYEREVPL